MTLVMYDSIYINQIPSDALNVAGYVGGSWPTYNSLVTTFPHANVLSIAPEAYMDAVCLDVEPYDATNSQVVPWLKRQLARGVHRPVIYSSADNQNAVYDEVVAAGIQPADVRFWSAHYAGEHICGPKSCGNVKFDCDGTQWTSNALGKTLDQSLLLDSFFTSTSPAPAPTIPVWETTIMNVIPTIQEGSTNKPFVNRVQGLLKANYVTALQIDGSFGPVTKAAVEALQKQHGLTVDGVVGPHTWSVLVTGA